MLAEGDDDRLVFNREHRGLRILRSSRQVSDGCARFPLRDGLRVDAVALGEAPQALLTMLYRSTDRLCRCGAAVKNLAHSASLHDNEKTAPSKPGIKHLVHARNAAVQARAGAAPTGRSSFAGPRSFSNLATAAAASELPMTLVAL